MGKVYFLFLEKPLFHSTDFDHVSTPSMPSRFSSPTHLFFFLKKKKVKETHPHLHINPRETETKIDKQMTSMVIKTNAKKAKGEKKMSIKTTLKV